MDWCNLIFYSYILHLKNQIKTSVMHICSKWKFKNKTVFIWGHFLPTDLFSLTDCSKFHVTFQRGLYLCAL